MKESIIYEREYYFLLRVLFRKESIIAEGQHHFRKEEYHF